MYGALDISTTGLIAQRTRLTAIAQNNANRNTLYDADGNFAPYQRRVVSFHAVEAGFGDGVGVRAEIELSDDPFQQRYDPSHPNADADGYLSVPNINPVIEQMNAMEAQRSYDANIAAAEATKAMMESALRLLA